MSAECALFQDARHLGKVGRGKIAFGWYGGKFSHLAWLLPLLPKCHHYIEPFGGSGAVLLNREPSPIETYNDFNGEVVNFFQVLRNHPEDLLRLLSLTPFSRAEYLDSLDPSDNLSELERARRFYVKTRQSFFGLSESASPGRWAYCKNTSRQGMSCSVSRWINGIPGLEEIAGRLMRAQIECLPALDLIKKYDDPAALFYVDPPYHGAARSCKKAYGQFEFTDEHHVELAEVLHHCKARVAVSGYSCPQMDDLYACWEKSEAPAKRINSSVKGGIRRECLWVNYEVSA
jgi:DNA adenine methylase